MVNGNWASCLHRLLKIVLGCLGVRKQSGHGIHQNFIEENSLDFCSLWGKPDFTQGPRRRVSSSSVLLTDQLCGRWQAAEQKLKEAEEASSLGASCQWLAWKQPPAARSFPRLLQRFPACVLCKRLAQFQHVWRRRRSLMQRQTPAHRCTCGDRRWDAEQHKKQELWKDQNLLQTVAGRVF